MSYRHGVYALLLAVLCFVVDAPRLDSANERKRQPADRPEPVDVGHFGAVGDSRADDTAAIQRAVDSRVGGVRFPRGTYQITKPIAIELDRVGFTSLVGDGTARIVMAGPGPAFRFIGTHEGTADPQSFKENVWQRQRMPMVVGLEIIGTHEQAVGIEARGTMQLTISRVNIREALHGIHLVERNRNVIIGECHIYDNRGAGVFLDNVNLHQINIANSHISYNDRGGVVVHGGNVCNIQIGTCDIEGNMSQNAPPTANVLLDAADGLIGEVAIVGCTIQHDHNASGSANVRIIGRSEPRPFTNERRHGNITIANNVMSDVQFNIDIRECRGVSIVGNTCWKGYSHNLRVEDSANILVASNVFDRNPRYHYGDGAQAGNGLVFRNCEDCTITGLHINSVWRAPAGLILERCRRFNVTNCTILDCDNAGLLLDDVSHNRVSDCLIRDDRPGGEKTISLKLTSGSANMIVNNLLAGPSEVAPGSAHVEANLQPR
ncbi:MAG: hypothetical protein AMJ84_08945 [Acidithiobacillales bacterium SM23_46]|nr:MAG: hypothetical protein AMJ84_08945 [Acidithiobacillales bacterium SM23_46]